MYLRCKEKDRVSWESLLFTPQMLTMLRGLESETRSRSLVWEERTPTLDPSLLTAWLRTGRKLGSGRRAYSQAKALHCGTGLCSLLCLNARACTSDSDESAWIPQCL